MKENKKERFKRITDARLKSLFNTLRLIGNCSSNANYEYSNEQVEEMFLKIQKELNKVRSRYTSKKTFTFKENFNCNEITLRISDKQAFLAKAIDDENFPAIEVQLLTEGKESGRLCFVEKNPNINFGEIGTGTYFNDSDNIRTYLSFNEKYLDFADEGICIKMQLDKVGELISDKISEILGKKVICHAHSDDSDYWTVTFSNTRLSKEDLCKLFDNVELLEEDKQLSMPEYGECDTSSIDMTLTEKLLQLIIGYSWETSLSDKNTLYLINLKFYELKKEK